MSWFMKIITCAGALAAVALCTCSCCAGFALLKQCSSFSFKHPWVMTLIRFWHNLGGERTSPLNIRIPLVPILSPRAAVTASQPRWHDVCLRDLTLAQTHYKQRLCSVHYERHYVESHSDLINIIIALLDYWLYPVVLVQDTPVLKFPLVWVKVFSVNQQLVFLWLCLRNSVCLSTMISMLSHALIISWNCQKSTFSPGAKTSQHFDRLDPDFLAASVEAWLKQMFMTPSCQEGRFLMRSFATGWTGIWISKSVEWACTALLLQVYLKGGYKVHASHRHYHMSLSLLSLLSLFVKHCPFSCTDRADWLTFWYGMVASSVVCHN